MAHGIDSTAYAGQVPWHGLGTYVGEEDVDSATMLRAAELDWTVSSLPAAGVQPDGRHTPESSEHRVLVRDDRRRILGTCTDAYVPFQNRELFQFLDSLRRDGASMRYHTAGSLFEGRKVWALLKLDGQLDVQRASGESEKLGQYLVMQSGHDGATAIVLQATTVRVVCNNTLTLALNEGLPQWRIKHTAGLEDKLEQARQALTGALEHGPQVAQLYSDLDRVRMSPEEFAEFALALTLRTDGDDRLESRDRTAEKLGKGTEQLRTRTEKALAEFYSAWHESPGANGDTRADALHAVTYMVDHKRATARDAIKRMRQLSAATESAWFGDGADKKRRAVRMLTRW